MTRGKGLVDGKAALYVCRDFACQSPITDPAQVGTALAGDPTTSPTRAPAAKTLAVQGRPGHATPEGTARFASRTMARPDSAPDAARGFTALGRTRLTVSRLGFGGYRTGTEEPEHRQALVEALRRGCNLIDTSTNYMDGDSERLVGSVLSELIDKNEVARDEIVVVSKVGYVQGENLARAQAREKAGRPYPDMVKYAEGLWHCLHPEFLADQLARSLDRLGLRALDVLLLHNVEYVLSDARHRGRTDLAAVRKDFYRRLEAAFAYLEQQVAAGLIRYYGVSSNTCTAEASNPEATSLSGMLEAARRAGGDEHHFAVLELPLNLLESGAVLTANTGPDASRTVLELAESEHVAVLVNRPLNAIPRGGPMIRLAALPVEPRQVVFEAQQEKVAALESEYRRELAPRVQTGGQGTPAEEYFTWAVELAKIRPQVQSLEHWEHVESQMIAPHLHQVLRALSQHFTGDVAERWEQWRDRYLPELILLLKELKREATLKSLDKTRRISEILDPLLPESRRREPLSRKALWVVASTPGVTSVLNGMRTPAYVADSTSILSWPPLPAVRPIYEALRTHA